MNSRRRGSAFPLSLEQVSRRPAARSSEPLRPQRPLEVAARDALPRAAASGIGLDSAAVRARMVQSLREQGVTHVGVLNAFQAVPRHRFIDTALAAQAYEDTSLPIGHAQTISKPSVIARMIELLFEGPAARARGSLGRTLEIGTGCGYQCALLAAVSPSVVSIERIRALFDRARDNLHDLRLDRVRLVYGDGIDGHAPNAPYQSIIAAAVGDDVPMAWLEQLEVGGRLVAPVETSAGQTLAVVDRAPSGYKRIDHERVCFVPLKSGLD